MLQCPNCAQNSCIMNIEAQCLLSRNQVTGCLGGGEHMWKRCIVFFFKYFWGRRALEEGPVGLSHYSALSIQKRKGMLYIPCVYIHYNVSKKSSSQAWEAYNLEREHNIRYCSHKDIRYYCLFQQSAGATALFLHIPLTAHLSSNLLPPCYSTPELLLNKELKWC